VRRGQRRGEAPAPIARWERDGDSEVLLLDTQAMTIHLKIGDRTVRRYEPIACDVTTRAPLWDALAVGEARKEVKVRRSPPKGWRVQAAS
jgi:hypothetical protein